MDGVTTLASVNEGELVGRTCFLQKALIEAGVVEGFLVLPEGDVYCKVS
jgi:hypothetical protein